MQCKNCGKDERFHEKGTKRCPLGPERFHATRTFEARKLPCRWKLNGICGKPGPCLCKE